MSQAFAYESPRVAPVPALRSLRRRFKGALVEPGGNGWDAATQAFNLTVRQEPAFVAFPQDARGRRRARRVRRVARHAGHRPAHRPQRRAARVARPRRSSSRRTRCRSVEIDAERKIARVGGGVKWGGGRPAGLRPRPRRAARLDAGRQRRRLLARRRRRLVRPQARPVDEQRHRDRARHRRRHASAASTPTTSPTSSGRCAAAAATSASSPRSRCSSTRSRTSTPASSSSRGSARPRCSTRGASGRRPSRRDHLGRPDPAVPADPGRSPSRCAAGSFVDRRGRLHGRRGERPRPDAAAARPRPGDGHLRDGRARRPRPSCTWTRRTRCRTPARARCSGALDARGDRPVRRRRRPGLRLDAGLGRDPPPRRGAPPAAAAPRRPVHLRRRLPDLRRRDGDGSRRATGRAGRRSTRTEEALGPYRTGAST